MQETCGSWQVGVEGRFGVEGRESSPTFLQADKNCRELLGIIPQAEASHPQGKGVNMRYCRGKAEYLQRCSCAAA